MAQTFTFEEASKGAPSAFDMALQAEGVTGKTADVARSIYQQESSSGKNIKTSNAGAVGAMQIVPTTFKGVADEGWDINDPVHNARAGIRYVKQMSELAGGDPELTAAGYYGGPGGLEKARKGVAVSDPRNPNAPTTLEYGKQVAARVPKGAVAQVMDKVTDAIIPSASAEEVPSGKAAPATFSFEEAIQPAPGQAPADAATPPKRSMIDELGHQLGLTARAAIAGVASIPAMASDAITGVVNKGLDVYDDHRAPTLSEVVSGKKKGFRFQRAGAAVNRLMDAAGVAQPENATERVVQDAASSIAGAGSMAGGGLALAKYAGGAATKGVGAMLADGSGASGTGRVSQYVSNQGLSAATGAGASGVVRESGGDEGAQIAAGLVGSMTPAGMAYAGRRPNGSKQLFDAATKAHGEGYVIPPADLNPDMLTELASGVSGKIKTAQVASQRNQNVTNQLARKALGMAPGDDLTTESLALIRQEAGQAYQAVSGAGVITPSAKYAQALDDAVKPFLSQSKSFPNRKLPALVDDIQALKTGQFDAADAVETIKVLRNETDAAYRAGDKLGGKAYKQAAQALEDAIDDHLVTIKAPADLLNGYRAARQTIAKTYTVEKALNSQTGNVNAQKLAADLTKGRPLSGELKTIAEVGQAFPKATQALKEAPKQVSPLDVFAGAGAALTGSNPALLASIAARPAVRSALLSGPVQRMAVKGAGAVSTGVAETMPAIAAGAATRATGTPQATPAAPNVFSFEEAQYPPGSTVEQEQAVDAAPAGAREGDPVPTPGTPGTPPFTSQMRPDGTMTVNGDAAALREMLLQAGVPAKSVVGMRDGLLVGRSQVERAQQLLDALSSDRDGTPQTPGGGAETEQQPISMQDTGGARYPSQSPESIAQPGTEAFDPARSFASQLRPNGTLSISGDAQAMRGMLLAAGIPSHTMTKTKDGLLIGRSQAGKVQEAIDRMHASAPVMPAPEAQQDQPVAQIDPAQANQTTYEQTQTQAAQGEAAPDQAAAAMGGNAAALGNVPGAGDAALQTAGLTDGAPPAESLAGASSQMGYPAQDPQPAAEPMASIDQTAHAAATSPLNDRPEPTPAQQNAGNYKLGHDRIAGMDVSIENPQGSVRRGVDPDGKPWETQMQHHYGYFKRSTAADGDKLDVFVKPGTPKDFAGPVFVIDQVDPRTGKLDEHKTILGAKDEAEAKEIYAANYAPDWKGMGSITRLPLAAFKAWAASGSKKEPLGDLQGEPVASAQSEIAPSPDLAAEQVSVGQSPDPVRPTPARQTLERIAALRDAGEHTVADLLQRKQTVDDVRAELSSMQAARPNSPHYGDAKFLESYEATRLAGKKPAEAAAHAGLISAANAVAASIGMREKAVNAMHVALQDMPIDKAAGFVERFSKALIQRGLMQPFEGQDQVARVLERSRDAAMHAALDSLYTTALNA